MLLIQGMLEIQGMLVIQRIGSGCTQMQGYSLASVNAHRIDVVLHVINGRHSNPDYTQNTGNLLVKYSQHVKYFNY